MKVGKRVVSVMLVVALAFGMVYIAPSASAAYVYNPSPARWTLFYDAFRSALGAFLGVNISNEYDFTFTTHGLVSYDQLVAAKEDYNSFVGRIVRAVSQWSASVAFTEAVISYDTVNDIWRLSDTATGEWIVDSRGRFPYFESSLAGDIPDDVASGGAVAPSFPGTPELSKLSSNRWLELAPIQTRLNSGALSGNTSYSYNQLNDLLRLLRQKSSTINYRLAPVFGGSYGVCKNNLVLCDSLGRPFIAFKEEASSAANQNQNFYVQNEDGGDIIVNGDKVTTDVNILDRSDNTFNMPVTNDNSLNFSGDFAPQFIYDTTYNFDDHSYTVNTYNTTYNNDNRTYITNFYTWNITYNITNTYVTYIGSNDAYQQKAYEFYYELPDGRSSADLTADEVAALSFQFADVMNYQQSATDTNLRALYHFDGDLSDAGFFSDRTAFTWRQGASITYMDSAVFEGALYLDDTAHQFDITLPSNIRMGEDFTLQFRYYQASQPDTLTNIENSVSMGDTTLFRWDERSLYTASSSSALCALPVGNWVELAVMRDNGTMYLYLNGVKAGSWASSSSLGKTITFALGSTSRAYSMLDELRVVDFAIAQGGANYTPTSVPYDSNLVLTLPGSEAVVDEYWEFQSPNNLIPAPDFTVEDYTFPTSVTSADGAFHWNLDVQSTYSPDTVSLEDGFLSLFSSSSSTSYLAGSGNTYGFFYPLYSLSSANVSSYAPGLSASDRSSSTTFTFSVVDTSGEVYSMTFSMNTTNQSASFPWGKLEYKYAKVSSGYGERRTLFITPARGQTIDLVYAELVKGSSSQVVATKVASVFDLSSLKPNTAAVHTAIPIHGYTVGGVRPTFPTRGDVWFAVTSGRVSSVQVYTGSAWTSSNARWWTGERWIPIYAFDIFTLEDCWDIADTDDVITPIESETAGWNWWKKAWTDFRSWLGGVFGGGSDTPEPSPSVDPSPDPSPSPDPGPDVDNRPLALAPGVSIIRENPATWTANNAASVSIGMETGDLWLVTNTVRNLFVVDLMNGASSDDLFVSLDVDGLPAADRSRWDVVSFLLYGDDDNYTSIRKASHFDGFSTALETSGWCRENDGSSADNGVTSATFALHKKGNRVRTFIKPSGGSWQEGETLTVDFAINKIGFCGWWTYDQGHTVTFSNLRMSTASKYALVKDTNTLLTSFSAEPIIPFFIGGGYIIPSSPTASPAPTPPVQTIVDPDGTKTSIWDFPAKLFGGLWSLLSGLVGVISGGVGGLFSFIGEGVGGFFGAFGNDGVFQFFTYGGADIWD